MKSNLDYLATTEFSGLAKTIEDSDWAYASRTYVSLDKMVQEVTGSKALGLREVFAYARTVSDPWNFFATLIEELEVLRARYGSNADQWVTFTNRVKKFLSELDQTQSEVAMESDRWAEFDEEADEDLTYADEDFYGDVTNDVPAGRRWSESLNCWVYGPSGIAPQKLTVGQKAWGFYNENATTDYQNSLVRLMWRGDKLFIGAISINLDGGVARCNVSGCKFTYDLHSDPHDTGNFDRVSAEYQTLVLLQHLGEHSRANPANYWNPINRVRQSRDSDYDKLDSASQTQSGLGEAQRVRIMHMLAE